MKIRNREVFRFNAELCKVLSSPTRLMILDMLGKREVYVGEIAETLGAQPATVSQHLRVLRDHRLVSSRKAGQSVYYQVANPKMTEACHHLRNVLLEDLKLRGAIEGDVTVGNLIEDTPGDTGPLKQHA